MITPHQEMDVAFLRERRRGKSTRQAACFSPAPAVEDDVYEELSIPVFHSISRRSLEDKVNLCCAPGVVLRNDYRMTHHIHTNGSSSSVHSAIDLRTNKQVVLKIMGNTKDKFDTVLSEIRVNLDLMKRDELYDWHAPLHEYFYFKEHLILVFDRMHGTLASITEPMDLAAIRETARELLIALKDLHLLGIVHTDIKPENVCMRTPHRSHSAGNIVLIDFGSVHMDADTRCSYVQSRPYRAPEVMLGMAWNAKVDLWSLGCLLAELVRGAVLFDGDTSSQVLAAQAAVLGAYPRDLLAHANPTLLEHFFAPDGSLYDFQYGSELEQDCAFRLTPAPTSLADVLRTTDAQLLDLLSGLLEYNPAQRLSAADALNHPFFG